METATSSGGEVSLCGAAQEEAEVGVVEGGALGGGGAGVRPEFECGN